MYYVVMERREDPQGEWPIFVSRDKQVAIRARDLRCEQLAGTANSARRERFESGDSFSAAKNPQQFLHLFDIVKVHKTKLPTMPKEAVE